MKAAFKPDLGKRDMGIDMTAFYMKPDGPSTTVKHLPENIPNNISDEELMELLEKEYKKMLEKMTFTEIDVPKDGTDFDYRFHLRITKWRDLAVYGRGALGLVMVEPEEVKREKLCSRFLKVYPREPIR